MTFLGFVFEFEGRAIFHPTIATLVDFVSGPFAAMTGVDVSMFGNDADMTPGAQMTGKVTLPLGIGLVTMNGNISALSMSWEVQVDVTVAGFTLDARLFHSRSYLLPSLNSLAFSAASPSHGPLGDLYFRGTLSKIYFDIEVLHELNLAHRLDMAQCTLMTVGNGLS